MSIAVELTPPADVMDALNEQFGRVPALMDKGFRRVMRPIGRRAVQALSAEPGAPQHPIRWKSERQKRKVLAMLREAGQLPYQRTGELARGWKYEIESLNDGGAFTVSNASPIVGFVQGDFAQPYHLDTGWPQAAPVLSDAQEAAEDAAIEVWYTVSNPLAGVPA